MGAPLSRDSARSTLIAVGLLAVVAVVYTWAQWQYFTARVSGGNDFMAHYAVWRSYLQEGLNPYSDEATLQTQLIIYGRPARPGEDSNQFAYPVYSIIVHGPFTALEYAVARSVFMTLLEAGLLIGVVLTLRLLHWSPPPWLLLIVIAWSLLNYHEARSILLGQVAVLGYGWFAICLYALHQRRDVLAGLMLTLLTIKPTLIFLLAPFLMAWAVRRRRWSFLFTFIGSTAALGLGSLIVWPTWVQDWLGRLTEYGDYVRSLGLIHLLTRVYWPGLGAVGEYSLIALVLIWTGLTWWQALRSAEPGGVETLWAIGVTTWTTNVIVAQAATPNYVLMLLPTLWGLAALDRRGGRIGRWAGILILITMLIGHWWLHIATVVGNSEQAIMFVPWPLVVAALLLLGRKWLMADAEQAGVSL